MSKKRIQRQLYANTILPPPVERQVVPPGGKPKPASAFKPDPAPAPPPKKRD